MAELMPASRLQGRVSANGVSQPLLSCTRMRSWRLASVLRTGLERRIMNKQTVRILRPGDEAELEAFLLPRVETSMFLVGNMRAGGLNDRGDPLEGTYVAAFEDGVITSVVSHYWNRVLILQAPRHVHVLWRTAVRSSHRPIGGVIGPGEQVSVVKEDLSIADAQVQMDETERLYRLPLDRLALPEPLRAGELSGRRIEARDLETVAGWQVAYQLEALGATDRPELWDECRSASERSLNQGDTWVLEHDGRLVATSSFNTAIDEAVQVGGVWTPPELRRQGYGRCVVAASLRDARAEGVGTAILFTGEENIPAQKAYLSLGFEHIGSYRLLLLSTPIDWPGGAD